jgi:hypothetical protein
MNLIFRIPAPLLVEIRTDLARPHDFAAERVGFISCNVASLNGSGILILVRTFHPVDDRDYLDDPTVGAMMGPDAIRKALQLAYKMPMAMFHVHLHEHHGTPWFSGTDLSENANFVPDFWHVQPTFPHGAIVLSLDSMAGMCWVPGGRKPRRIQDLTAIGAPMRLIRGQA